MSPLVILIASLGVVIGGVLLFRVHAFLVLIVGALVVAALTPPAAIQRFELRRDDARISAGQDNDLTVRADDPRKSLIDGQRYDVYRIQNGQTPARIGSANVRVTTSAATTSGVPGERRVEVHSIQPNNGERVASGDYLVAPQAAKSAARISNLPLGQRVAEGFGRTALDIGILIAMASILGTCLLGSRGAAKIVASIQQALGEKRTPIAFLGSGFLLGIPMFAEAVFYLLLPLAKAFWARTGSNYVLCVLAIVAGATMTHSLVPPTPGPLFAASELGVSLTLMMTHGSIVGAIAALCGYLYAVRANRTWVIPVREDISANEAADADPKRFPPLLAALAPVLLPVVLISVASIFESRPVAFVPDGLKSALRILGDKNLALTLSAALAIGLAIIWAPVDPTGLRKLIRTAIIEAGETILIIAAGGALGYTLRQAGMAELAGAAVPDWKLGFLPVAWGITAVIRIAQGSATVAMITAVGIVGPLVADAHLGYHAVYVAVAIGCGSKIGMWMNDSGFWVISKMSGMTEGETLKTASTMVFIEGCAGLVATMILAAAWPLQ